MRETIAVAATASGGEMMAPRATATAHGIPGISIRAAIEGIADQVQNPKFRTMLMQMKKDVESGKQFSEALLRFPKTFSPLYINMVKASELS